MPPVCTCIVTAAIVLNCLTAHSQKIFFEQLTTAEGLPSDYVNCVFEDSKGNLWIGTDKGACRYDGRIFENFSNDNGLPSNFISCFAEDPTGNIWIGTVDGGACIFDGNEIKPFNLSRTYGSKIRDILFNPDKSFFIVVDPYGLIYFPGLTALPQSFPDYSFIKKVEDNLFITGVYGGLCLLEKNGQQLLKRPYPEPSTKQNFFAWLSDSGMIVMEENLLQNFVIEKNGWVKKNDFFLDINLPSPSWVNLKKVLVNENELLVATTNGLIFIDKTGKQFVYTAENGLGTNFINSILKDKRGNIYICTYGAGIKVWPAGYLAEYKVNGKVTSLFPSQKDTYISTTKSVYRFDLAEKSINELKFPGTSNFTAVSKLNETTLLLGTLNSFYKIPVDLLHHGSLANINKYRFNANTGASGFAALNHRVYISTYGDGIFVFDEVKKSLDTIRTNTNPPTPAIVESLVPLNNSLAALTYNSGLTIHTQGDKHAAIGKQQGLLSNTVYSAFVEREGRIWIGTRGGLNLFDGKHIIRTFSSKEGFIGTNVLDIFKDRLNRLWILSDKFLHLVESEKLRAIRSQPILYNGKQLINRAIYSKENDVLYIGLTDAMLTVDMSKIVIDTVVNFPKLLSIVKDSLNLPFGTSLPLSISNPASKISFRFANVHHSIERNYDLYYKLKGFDDKWKLLDNTDEAFYQKLPPGNYELLAKTINPDGYSSTEISLAAFEVLPPLWQRSWFVVAMALILLAAFFWIGNFLSRKRYKRKLRSLEEEYRVQLERERIARELHDNVGSQLTYLINKINDDYPRLAEKDQAEKLSGVARSAMQELRETIWALDKKEMQWDDLQYKMRQLIRLYKTEKCDVGLDWKAENSSTLNPLEALNIYRIIQEALNNAGKYSNASLVKIEVRQYDEGVLLEIKDNGIGFDIRKTDKGYGLKNMEKRAEEMNGRLQIESQPGAGTIVKLYLK